MKSAASSPEAYIAQLDEPRRSEIETLRAVIRGHAPALAPYLAHGMLGFGPYRYQYASGREGDSCWIGLASQKNYISVYVSGLEGERYLAETYRDRLPKANIGKSCVRFKRYADLDSAVFTELIERSAALYPAS